MLFLGLGLRRGAEGVSDDEACLLTFMPNYQMFVCIMIIWQWGPYVAVCSDTQTDRRPSWETSSPMFLNQFTLAGGCLLLCRAWLHDLQERGRLRVHHGDVRPVHGVHSVVDRVHDCTAMLAGYCGPHVQRVRAEAVLPRVPAPRGASPPASCVLHQWVRPAAACLPLFSIFNYVYLQSTADFVALLNILLGWNFHY
jgi:hypothetical protein